jgi:hypothetical protein
MAEEENNFKEAEIRRDDITKLLENTRKLAGMYSDLLQIKKEGWKQERIIVFSCAIAVLMDKQ